MCMLLTMLLLLLLLLLMVLLVLLSLSLSRALEGVEKLTPAPSGSKGRGHAALRPCGGTGPKAAAALPATVQAPTGPYLSV